PHNVLSHRSPPLLLFVVFSGGSLFLLGLRLLHNDFDVTQGDKPRLVVTLQFGFKLGTRLITQNRTSTYHTVLTHSHPQLPTSSMLRSGRTPPLHALRRTPAGPS